MATIATERTTAVGVFDDRDQAQRAINELRRMGFREDEIGVAARNDDTVSGGTALDDRATNTAIGACAGAATGASIGAVWGMGIIAGLLPGIGPVIAGGALAAVLASAATGAAAAGLAGALLGFGLSEDEATHYETEFKAGRIIVTVQANGRYPEALAALERNGAADSNRR
jgi:hypothetical protein